MKAETNTSDYESYDTDGWRSFCSSATNPWLDDKQPIEQIPLQQYNAEVETKSLSWQELLKLCVPYPTELYKSCNADETLNRRQVNTRALEVSFEIFGQTFAMKDKLDRDAI